MGDLNCGEDNIAFDGVIVMWRYISKKCKEIGPTSDGYSTM